LAAAAEFCASAENQPKKKFGQVGAADSGASSSPLPLNICEEWRFGMRWKTGFIFKLVLNVAVVSGLSVVTY